MGTHRPTALDDGFGTLDRTATCRPRVIDVSGARQTERQCAKSSCEARSCGCVATRKRRSGSYRCGGAGCGFDFSDVDATWTLEVPALVRENSTTRIPSAVLLERSGAGAVACGGARTLTWSNEAFSIRIDQLGELASCPGTPIDGELSGAM